ncbi:MAG TPA: hypothetical protein VFK09_09950 [Gemmatimonadales bacterium]|jgi:hypothetical protein|nr:hypothetical protein [Gemmatimonadales bacterium]
MKTVASLLVLCGAAGLILGIVTMIEDARNPGLAPFRFENYGGPGPLLGALILLLGGIYLLARSRSEG